MQSLQKYEAKDLETVSIGGRMIRIPTDPASVRRVLYEQYKRLMDPTDDEFRQWQTEEKELGLFDKENKSAPDEIMALAKFRILDEDKYMRWFHGVGVAPSGETAIVPHKVSEALARRLEVYGISVETAIELSSDHRTKPANIAKWAAELRLNQDEITYLLQVRTDFAINEVSFSDLHRLWVACGNERCSFEAEHGVGGGAGQGIFESLLHHAQEADGITRWSVWRLYQKLDYFYDGDADRLLHDLNEYGWEMVFAGSTDHLTIAGRELDDMNIESEEGYLPEEELE